MTNAVIRRIMLACTLATAWILSAYFFRHPGDTDPEPVRLALAALALWFVACGAWAQARARTPLTAQLLWYGTLSGVHWGGPIGVGSEAWLGFQLGAFVVLGGVLAQATFVDLARRLGGRQPRFPRAPYLPALLGAAVPLALLLAPDHPIAVGALSVLYACGVLMSLIGGVMLLTRPILKAEDRFENAILAAALAVGWLPHAMVAAGLIDAGSKAGLLNLPLAVIPAAVAWRILRPSAVQPH